MWDYTCEGLGKVSNLSQIPPISCTREGNAEGWEEEGSSSREDEAVKNNVRRPSILGKKARQTPWSSPPGHDHHRNWRPYSHISRTEVHITGKTGFARATCTTLLEGSLQRCPVYFVLLFGTPSSLTVRFLFPVRSLAASIYRSFSTAHRDSDPHGRDRRKGSEERGERIWILRPRKACFFGKRAIMCSRKVIFEEYALNFKLFSLSLSLSLYQKP